MLADKGDLQHEEVLTIQKQYFSDVLTRVDVVDQIGQPFQGESTDQFSIDKKIVRATDGIKAKKNTTKSHDQGHARILNGSILLTMIQSMKHYP